MDANQQTVSLTDLDRFCREVLTACGADEATSDATTRALMHATRCGVDSHGVRLLGHYIKALEGGRLNKSPEIRRVSGFSAVETLDGDHAQGAVPAYAAMTRAIELARQFGIGAVGIRNNSHFGAAGAYSIEAARQGLIGLSFCNSDSFVRLHDGASRFHGTNPISMAVPIEGEDPWLLDMATSAVPFNRVLLYRSTGATLPDGVASDAAGIDTTNANLTEMLAPVGAAFGFKGAALAGIAEIFSAVLTGMKLSFDIAPMNSDDMHSPRHLGAFVMAILPEAFGDRATFEAGMKHYVETLRSSPARDGASVMAPGDREWKVARHRDAHGVELDPATREAFLALSARYNVSMPM